MHPIIRKIEEENNSLGFWLPRLACEGVINLIKDHKCVWIKNMFPQCNEFYDSGNFIAKNDRFKYCPHCAGLIEVKENE